MYRQEEFLGRTWLAPSQDKTSIAHRYSTKWHIDACLPLLKGQRAVVQAGGNLGQWPHYLSGLFERVYTFEPDPDNFFCLVNNLQGIDNIFKFQMALGKDLDITNIETVPDNCEGNFLGDSGATCPVGYLEGLIHDDVDLILLDLEGYELFALQGAEYIIKLNSPVILIEDRLQSRYDYTTADIDSYLTQLGYSRKDQASKDIIYAR